MTAEVAILNKHAVAMAADSAVTIGDLKVFNTVSKLFALSKSHPVGIMVYSSAEIMGVPVETVVKEFRRCLGHEGKDTIEEYCSRFEEYLRDDKTLFPDEARAKSLSTSALNVIHSLAQEASFNLGELLQNVPGWGHPTEEEARDAFAGTITKFEKYVKKCPEVPNVSASLRKTIADAIDADLDNAIKWIGQSFPINADCKKRIGKLVLDQLVRETRIGGETGVVIAGFGESEVFPGLRAMEFQCSALGLHNCPYRMKLNVSHNNTAHIAPFAQSDVMSLFVEGREPGYDSFIRDYITGFFEEEKNRLLNSATPQIRESDLVEDLGSRLISMVTKELAAHSKRDFIEPTMQVVAAMPKEELAILAEALVNLTGLKRKASRDKETVGGPTDVAVVSKGDGFIWISRKHYFDPRLNPQFVSKYMELRS